MKKEITAIIVGLGGQSLNDHIPALIRRRDVKIIGACDPSREAQEAFNKSYPQLEGVVVANDLTELLAKVSPMIAVIAVPHDNYFKIVAELCKHKIYCCKEKPLARDIAEAKRLLAIPGFGKYVFISTQRRYGTVYQEARDWISKIGSPYLFHAVYKLNIGSPDEGWRGKRSSAGGGCLIDMGYHLVDQLLWWFGTPQKVHAQISTLAVPDSDYDAEDSATISFRYANGLHGTLLISRAAGEKREEYELYGSEGYLTGSKKRFTVYDRKGSILNEVAIEDTSSMLDAQMDFFISRVQDGEEFSDIQQNHLADMEFIDRCYKDALEDHNTATEKATVVRGGVKLPNTKGVKYGRISTTDR